MNTNRKMSKPSIRQAAAGVIEPMEQRRMMSASLTNGVLSVTGTANDDAYVLSLSNSKIVVKRGSAVEGEFASSQVNRISAVLGSGNDTWDSSAINKRTYVAGESGNDTLKSGNALDTLYGGSGNDRLVGMGERDYLYGEADNDELFGADGHDILVGGAGSDFMSGGTGSDRVDYTAHTSPVRVTLDGRKNDGASGEYDHIISDVEIVYGSNGNDVLVGSTGNDYLHGYGGADILNGEAGHDTLIGGTGGDAIVGGAGNDMIDGQAGSDQMSGGTGNDTVDYRLATSRVKVTQDGLSNDGVGNGAEKDNVFDDIEIIYGSKYNDRLAGGNNYNAIYGGAGDDFITGGGGVDALHGEDGNDTLHGNDGNDILRGNAGNDDLHGGNGRDELFGDSGHDGLFGGRDAVDSLTGGTGNDRFLQTGFIDLSKSVSGTIPQDKLNDVGIYDARIHLDDSYQPKQLYDVGSGYADVTFKSAKWTDAEVAAVDESVGRLHRETGNAALIGGMVTPLRLTRVGDALSHPWLTTPISGSTNIYSGFVTNSAFSSTNATRYQTNLVFADLIFNRMGEADQSDWASNGRWVYGSDNKWVKTNPNYVKANFGWYRHKDEKFVSNAARAHSQADFKETLVKVMWDKNGWANTFSDVPVKENWVKAFIDSK
jgi:Ca2+-binding RTX toxin-like protein